MYCKILIYNLIHLICVIMGTRNFHITYITEDLLETCIVDIISPKSQRGSEIVVVNNDVVTNNLISRIHETYNVKLYVKDVAVHVTASPSAFVIYVRNLTDLDNSIDHLDKDWNRKPDALYIIILVDSNYSEENLKPFFKTLWKYHIIHTLVIFRGTNENGLIYSYLPYAEGGCGRNYNHTIKISDCVGAKESNILEALSEHDKPVLKNCTLQIGTHNYPPIVVSPNLNNTFPIGIEIFILNLLAEMENISLNYVFFPESLGFGFISDNYTVDGILEKLYKNEMDIVVGAFGLNSRRAIFFDFICSHFAYEDSFVAVVPCAGLVERWRMIYTVFNPPVWVLVLLVFVFCSILLSRNNCEKWLELFNLLGHAVQNVRLSLRHDNFKNVIIVHWLWFVFIVNCFFQTRLTSFTTFRVYKPQMNQYVSLYNQNFTPCFALEVAPFLKGSGHFPIIHEKYLETEGCETSELALDTVAKTQVKYTLLSYYRYAWWKNNKPKDEKKVHVMKEKLFNLLYAIFLNRGFPLLHDFELKLLRLVEYGFVDAIKQFYRIPNYRLSASDVVGSFEISSLKLVDFVIPFGILITGLVLSLVIFIIELSHPIRKVVLIK